MKSYAIYRIGILSEFFVPKTHLFEILDFKNAATLKTRLGVRQGHWKCHHVIECILY